MNKFPIIALSLLLAAVTAMTSCGGGNGQPPPPAPAAPSVNVNVGLKQLIFSWAEVSGATHYRLLENADGNSGFTQVGTDIPAGTLSVNLEIAVHLQDFGNALYMVQACNATGCTISTEVNAMNGMLAAIGYFKASNTDADDQFGFSVALSADGTALAVGARLEDSNATGVGGDQNDNSTDSSGAVYVFRFDGTDWFQQAYVKASNSEFADFFGDSVALSADGNTLAVGAFGERSNAIGVGGDQTDNTAGESGAVYVFRFDGTDWSQQAYVKASNTELDDQFGWDVSLSADGNTLAVGANREDSNATGINGNQNDNSAILAGAVYLYRFDGTTWSQQAYVKASNTGQDDQFGFAVALSADGNTLAVAAINESSGATGVGGDQSDNSAPNSGAVYLFQFDGTDWLQLAYVKASNTGAGDGFAAHVALNADGDTLAVGAINESSNATGINGDQSDNSAFAAGAVYLFRFDGTTWSQQAYAKASNTGTEIRDYFGTHVALSADGNTLAVGTYNEDSNATGVGGDQTDNTASNSGAAYLFRFDGTAWSQQAYVKASNSGQDDQFGRDVALSADGNTLAVGARYESGNATGINGDQSTDSSARAGAVYVY